jgi:uncharacterized protein
MEERGMTRRVFSVRRLAAWVFVTLLLAGCAQMPGGTSDSERLSNAIAIDDAGFIEDAVRSGRLGVNQRISAPGYLEGAPLILIAAKYGALNTLRFLISAGANVNAQAMTGETALMLASYFSGEERSSERHERAVRMLVEAGASLENPPGYYTALAYAAYQGHLRIVRYLIERGARVDADADNGTAYVNTPLMMAAMQGHRDTALWLLRAGANPRIRIHRGHTASELAMKNNHANVLGLLRCAERLAPGESFALRCER